MDGKNGGTSPGWVASLGREWVAGSETAKVTGETTKVTGETTALSRPTNLSGVCGAREDNSHYLVSWRFVKPILNTCR